MAGNYRTIVVGTDGSALAGPTVARASALAVLDDADLVIVCAVTRESLRDKAKAIETIGADTDATSVAGVATASQAIDDAAAVANAAGARVTAALMLEGEATAVLLETASRYNADLIVIGAIQDVSIAERLLGTVASEIVRRATTDVLIIRPPAGLAEIETGEDVEVAAPGDDA